MASLLNENQAFLDDDGEPIVNGKIYIGAEGLDPITNPISIYSNRELTTSLSNPQSTDSFGRSVNKIWIMDKYSIQVNDEEGIQRYQDLDAGNALTDLSESGGTIGAFSGDLIYGRLGDVMGAAHGVATLGSSSVSAGTGKFDSYSILELVHRHGIPDDDGIQTTEIDWVYDQNTGGATKKKIAAIEVFTEGTTANDRGGRWQVDTKRDGGVLTNALIINNQQQLLFPVGAALKPQLVAEGSQGTGIWWAIPDADPNNDTFNISVNALSRMRIGVDRVCFPQSMMLGSFTELPKSTLHIKNQSGITFEPTTDNYNWRVGANILGSNRFYFINSVGLDDFTFADPLMYMDADTRSIWFSNHSCTGDERGPSTFTVGINNGIPSVNGSGNLRFINSNSVRNWNISSNRITAGNLEFTPSTANGGNVFTTPALKLGANGSVTIPTLASAGSRSLRVDQNGALYAQ